MLNVYSSDRVTINLGSTGTAYARVVLAPNIHDPNLPEPFKSRYQTPTGNRIPCNDMKIADQLKCQDIFVYCTGPDDILKLVINAPGEMYTMEEKCSKLFSEKFNWEEENRLLFTDTTSFVRKYVKNEKLIEFGGLKAKLKDSRGVEIDM